jgi:hypothetical protein
MKKKICVCALAAFVLGLMPFQVAPLMSPLCAFADSFNMKAGAWELTYNSTTSGNPFPPEMLEKMPPERRAKVEEAMKARSGQPKTRVHKGCITQKDLDQNKFIKGEGEGETDCTVKVLTKSATKLVMERSCPAHEANYKISIDAKTPETVVGTIDGSIRSGQMHTDLKGQWLGESCDETKDRH